MSGNVYSKVPLCVQQIIDAYIEHSRYVHKEFKVPMDAI
jgi:hypothetical protein